MSTFTHSRRCWARLIAGVRRRFGEAMRLSRSFPFVDVHVDGIDDSEVRLVRTCSLWKYLRGPLPSALTCSPRLRVQLRGLAHFHGETCARKGSIGETDC